MSILLNRVFSNTSSLEQHSDEIEYTFYVLPIEGQDDNIMLSLHEAVLQEQYEVAIYSENNEKVGFFRSRSEDSDNYEFTVKRKATGKIIETNLQSNLDMHGLVKSLAQRGYLKYRKTIPVAAKHKGEDITLYWEVDRYFLNDGTDKLHQMVKVDLEVPEVGISIPKLPLATEEVIVVGPDSEPTEEEQLKIDEFYQSVSQL